MKSSRLLEKLKECVNEENIKKLERIIKKHGKEEVLTLEKEEGVFFLQRACRHQKWKAVRFFIEEGWDIHQKDENGFSPILRASYHHRFEIVKMLYEKGANINDERGSGYCVIDGFYEKDWEYWLPILEKDRGRLNEKNAKRIKMKRLELLFK